MIGTRPDKMKVRIFPAWTLALALAAALVLSPGPAPGQSPAPGRATGGTAERAMAARTKMARAVQAEQQAQKQADALYAQTTVLTEKSRRLREELRWLDLRISRQEAYKARAEKAVAELRDAERRMKELEQSLDPLLDETVAALAGFVSSDLPFLPRERKARLDDLQRTLADYSMPLCEKLSRVLEAMQVEAAYGSEAAVDDGSADLDDGPVAGQILRLGRAALFFVSRDGATAARFLPGDAAWEILPENMAGDVRSAMDMVRRRRAFDLAVLPVEREDRP